MPPTAWPTPRCWDKGKSARVTQTMGMPGIAYRLFFGAHGAKAFMGMLGYCGIAPVRIRYFGTIDPAERDTSVR